MKIGEFNIWDGYIPMLSEYIDFSFILATCLDLPEDHCLFVALRNKVFDYRKEHEITPEKRLKTRV